VHAKLEHVLTPGTVVSEILDDAPDGDLVAVADAVGFSRSA
jgi:hypothetical protein